jgi:large subunit ribosomal protein L24
MKLSVRKGDYVKIIAGSDKGKTAQIVAVDVDGGRVVLDGKDIGMLHKAKKARKANEKGGIIPLNKTVDASNVMPVCASCGKPTRVKHGIVAGKKVRVCKCGEILETKKIKEDRKAKATVRKKKKEEAAETKAAEKAKHTVNVPEKEFSAVDVAVTDTEPTEGEDKE